jgi:hypothetical protein
VETLCETPIAEVSMATQLSMAAVGVNRVDESQSAK